jgi:hypothetical protein
MRDFFKPVACLCVNEQPNPSLQKRSALLARASARRARLRVAVRRLSTYEKK